MKTFAKYVALIAVLTFFMTPIVWTAITAIKPTEPISSQPIVWIFKPTLDHFRVIFFENNILTPLLNSTIIAVLSTLGVLITAAPAWACGDGNYFLYLLLERIFVCNSAD